MRKSLVRLAAGWLLMLAGALLMFDGGASTSGKSHSTTWLAVEELVGFGLVVAGAVLRRSAIRRAKTDTHAWPHR